MQKIMATDVAKLRRPDWVAFAAAVVFVAALLTFGLWFAFIRVCSHMCENMPS